MQGADLLRDPEFLQTLDRSPFQVRDLPGLSNAIAGTLERLSPEQRQMMRQVLDELDDLSEEELSAFLRLIAYIDQNPEEYPKFIQQLSQSGAFEPGEIPEKYDPHFTAIVKTLVGQALQKVRGNGQQPTFARGGIVSLREQAAKVRSYGRNGDSLLAHISPFEASMLNRIGAGGKINPKTGLPEFSLWTSIRKVLVPIAQIAATAALTFFGVPPMISGAIVGGVSSLLSGGSATDALKAGLIGGATAGLASGVSSVLGGGEFLSGAFQGTGLFGATTSSLFGGSTAGASGAASAPPGGVAPAAATAPAAGEGAPVAPPEGVSPTAPVAAAKESLTGGAGEFFSKVMTPEGIKDIWANYKIPIMLAGGAGLIGLSNAMDGKTRKPGIVKGQTGADLLSQQPGTYGFDVAKFTQQPAPTTPPVFPGGGYVAPSIAATPVPPPQYERFEYPSPYTAGIMSAKVGGHISGPGHGTSDSIPARLSDGEFVMTAKAVRGAGDGDRMKGARRMYELMHKFERMA